MPVRELKAMLLARGVSAEDVLEKEELVQLVAALQESAAEAGAGTGAEFRGA